MAWRVQRCSPRPSLLVQRWTGRVSKRQEGEADVSASGEELADFPRRTSRCATRPAAVGRKVSRSPRPEDERPPVPELPEEVGEARPERTHPSLAYLSLARRRLSAPAAQRRLSTREDERDAGKPQELRLEVARSRSQCAPVRLGRRRSHAAPHRAVPADEERSGRSSTEGVGPGGRRAGRTASRAVEEERRRGRADRARPLRPSRKPPPPPQLEACISRRRERVRQGSRGWKEEGSERAHHEIESRLAGLACSDQTSASPPSTRWCCAGSRSRYGSNE